jgi:hypothetical protein
MPPIGAIGTPGAPGSAQYRCRAIHFAWGRASQAFLENIGRAFESEAEKLETAE